MLMNSFATKQNQPVSHGPAGPGATWRHAVIDKTAVSQVSWQQHNIEGKPKCLCYRKKDKIGNPK